MKIKQLVQKKIGNDYEVNLPELKKPRLKIPNVCDKIEKDTFVQDLIEQNEVLNGTEINLVKIVEKKVNRRTIYDVIIETYHMGYDLLMQMKSVYVGYSKCYVVDHVHILRCFKCSGFSHLAKDCKNKQACSRCAGDHKSTQCRSKRECCINCSTANKKFNLKLDVNHHAYSTKCITLLRKINRFKTKIQYSEE